MFPGPCLPFHTHWRPRLKGRSPAVREGALLATTGPSSPPHQEQKQRRQVDYTWGDSEGLWTSFQAKLCTPGFLPNIFCFMQCP